MEKVSKALLSLIEQLGEKDVLAKLREELCYRKNRAKRNAENAAYNARKPLTSTQWKEVKFPAFVRVKWRDRPDTAVLIASKVGDGIARIKSGRGYTYVLGGDPDQVVEYLGSISWPDINSDELKPTN